MSVKKLMQKTLSMTRDNGAYKSCVAAQVVDVDQKISVAIAESIRLLRCAQGVSMGTSVLVFASSISTPTISRLLCDSIARCFGFVDVKTEDVDSIMSK